VLDIFATLSQHFRTMKHKKNAPASTVELHNVSIPIHKREDVKNGVTYTGFLFFYMKDGKRIQVRRANLADAEAAAKDAIRGMVAARGSSFTVTPAEHAELSHALSILRQHPGTSLTSAINGWHDATNILPAGATLNEAARFYAAHLAKDKLQEITVADLVASWKKAKQHEGLSDYYVKDTHRRMSLFSGTFQCPVASVTPLEISAWLGKTGHRGRNLNNTRNAVVTLFSFARARGYLPRAEKHAAELTERVKERPNAIGIYTPAEIAKIMQAAPDDMRAAIAIGAFAGLRSAEIFRLDWSEVKLERGHILVSPEKAKTAQRRIVPILPNLAAWLATVKEREGRVCPNYMNLTNLTRRMSEICKAAGVEPKHNALRHSFASYRLAVVESADKVALEMGNSPRKLFTNYRELVTAADAAAWFAVSPEPAGNVIQLKVA
jgi:integrase